MEEVSINLGEELERKTLDALSQVLTDYQQGAVSQPMARYALHIIFMTTAGLTSKDAFELVSQGSAEINADERRDQVRRFFVHPGKQELLLLEYQYGEAEVTLKRGKYPRKPGDVNIWERTSKATFESEINPFEAAQQRFTGYAQSLIRSGFQEIL